VTGPQAAPGLCRMLPDLWSTRSNYQRAYAAHVCGHCPILQWCDGQRRGMPAGLLDTVVMAGVAHSASGKPVKLKIHVPECHLCAPLHVRVPRLRRTPAREPRTNHA